MRNDDFMLEMRSGSSAMVITRVRNAMAHPQLWNPVFVSPLQPEKQRPSDEAEGAKIIDATQIRTAGMALDAFQQVYGFGAGKDAHARGAARIAEGQANNVGFVFAFIRLVRVLGNFSLRCST